MAKRLTRARSTRKSFHDFLETASEKELLTLKGKLLAASIDDADVILERKIWVKKIDQEILDRICLLFH